MSEQWKRKDFSKDSKIRDTLLKEMLAYHRELLREIPEEYEDQIAAAGSARVNRNFGKVGKRKEVKWIQIPVKKEQKP